MTAIREAKNSNHTMPSGVLVGLTAMFILVLAVLVTMFLVAVISVG